MEELLVDEAPCFAAHIAHGAWGWDVHGTTGSSFSIGKSSSKILFGVLQWYLFSLRPNYFLLFHQIKSSMVHESMNHRGRSWGSTNGPWPKIYPLVICYSSPWKPSPFLSSVNHLFRLGSWLNHGHVTVITRLATW